MTAVLPQSGHARIDRPVLQLWASRIAGNSAQQMMLLTVGWQMYELTRDPWDLGLIGLFQFGPAFVLTLFGGQAADRWHRGRIVTLCLAAQAIGAALLLQGSLRGLLGRELLLAVCLLLGAVRGFQMPAQQALLPLLVSPQQYPRATAFVAGGGQAAIIAGPAVGGWLLLFGPAVALACCLALFALAGVLVATLRLRAMQVAREPLTLHSLLSGARFVWQQKTMLGALSLDLLAVLFGGVTALLPMFARDVLQVGPAGLGLLRSAPAAGALGMSLLLARFPIERRIGFKMTGAVAVYGAAMLVFGLSQHALLSLLALAVSGGADMVSIVVRHSLVQLQTPDALRGRVGAINAVFMGASNQLGEFESGATAAWLGPAGSVVLGGVLTLVCCAAWVRVFPTLWRTDTFASS